MACLKITKNKQEMPGWPFIKATAQTYFHNTFVNSTYLLLANLPSTYLPKTRLPTYYIPN